jgi:hypothetical protein
MARNTHVEKAGRGQNAKPLEVSQVFAQVCRQPTAPGDRAHRVRKPDWRKAAQGVSFVFSPLAAGLLLDEHPLSLFPDGLE